MQIEKDEIGYIYVDTRVFRPVNVLGSSEIMERKKRNNDNNVMQ